MKRDAAAVYAKRVLKEIPRLLRRTFPASARHHRYQVLRFLAHSDELCESVVFNRRHHVGCTDVRYGRLPIIHPPARPPHPTFEMHKGASGRAKTHHHSFHDPVLQEQSTTRSVNHPQRGGVLLDRRDMEAVPNGPPREAPSDWPGNRTNLGRSITPDTILMLSRRILQSMRFTGRNDSMPRPSRPRGRARALQSSGPFLANSVTRSRKTRESCFWVTMIGSISFQKFSSCRFTTSSSWNSRRKSKPPIRGSL